MSKSIGLSDLAAKLNISKQALSKHTKKPDAPPISDENGWILYLAASSKNGTGSDLNTVKEINKAKLKGLIHVAGIKEVEERKARGLSLEKAQVERAHSRAQALLYSGMEKMIEDVPPLLCGQESIKIRNLLHSRVWKVLKDWESALNDFEEVEKRQ